MLEDFAVHYLDLNLTIVVAFGFDRMPLDRMHDKSIHLRATAYSLEAMSPPVAGRHVGGVDADTADPFGKLVAHAQVGRVDAILLALPRKRVEKRRSLRS